jgi:spermidine synthase
MKYVDVARARSERGEIVLRERRDPDGGDSAPAVLELRVNGVFVMDTVETSTEKALATAALKQAENPRAVLVGGLGLGYTLHEVLADQRVERLVVVEIEEALVQWMRDGTVPHGPGYLADERLTLVNTDILLAMAEATPAAYDLVLVDVDNGPGYLVYEDNEAIYRRDFLEKTKAALRPGGAVVIWSSEVSEALSAEMEHVFGKVVEIPYDVTLQDRDERYWLYLSRR